MKQKKQARDEMLQQVTEADIVASVRQNTGTCAPLV